MELHRIFLGILVFGLFITAGIYVMFGSEKSYQDPDGLFNEYDVGMNSSKFSDIRTVVDETYNLSSAQKEDLVSEEVEQSLSWENLVIAPYKALQRIPGYFKIVGVVINSVSRELGIPPFFSMFAAIAFMILVIFMIIYMVMRFKPT